MRLSSGCSRFRAGTRSGRSARPSPPWRWPMGEAGVALAARVSYAVVLGPVFAWYLLARGVIGLTQAAAWIESGPLFAGMA